MGEIIEIDEEVGLFEYRIRFSVTNEKRYVSVDPESRELFLSTDTLQVHPMACPFLRQKGKGPMICAVHASRPDLCRSYACFRILVFDTQGNKIGRVQDASRILITRDTNLANLWSASVVTSKIKDEQQWEANAERILAQAGYRVVR